MPDNDEPRTLADDDLDRASRELLKELRQDERVDSISVQVMLLGPCSDQYIARARATLRTGEICEAHMFTVADAVWALALDDHLRAGQRSPRRRRTK